MAFHDFPLGCASTATVSLDLAISPSCRFSLGATIGGNITQTSSIMVSLLRTLRSIRRVGIKEWFHQLQTIGDAKSGRLVGVDQ